MVLYVVARLLSFFARRLPQKSLYAVAVVFGDILYLFWWRARRNARENMRRALGPQATGRAVGRAAREAFCNCMKYYAEFLRGHDDFLEKIDFSGMENIDAALADGKGAILVGLHMGSLEVAALSVAQARYLLNVVVDEEYLNVRINRWIQKMRSRLGMKVIAAKREAMPNLVRALKRNEVLALLIDCPQVANIKVKFCGAGAKVPGGAAALALRTGAKIVVATTVRTRGNRFAAFLGRPLQFEPTGDFSRDVQVLTQRIMEALEPMVQTYPEQWFMFRRIWVEG